MNDLYKWINTILSAIPLPLTCWIPNFSTKLGGNILDAKARLNMALNSESKPPLNENAKFIRNGNITKKTLEGK